MHNHGRVLTLEAKLQTNVSRRFVCIRKVLVLELVNTKKIMYSHLLKCTTLLKLSGILSCKLVHNHGRVLTLEAKLQTNVSRRFVCIRKVLVLELVNTKKIMYSHLLKCTTLLKLSGILSCKLVHNHGRVLTLEAKLQTNVSRRFVCIRKVLVLELVNTKKDNVLSFVEMHHTAKIIWHFVLQAGAQSW